MQIYNFYENFEFTFLYISKQN